MRAGETGEIADIVVGAMRGVIAEAELQDAHAGKAEFGAQRFDLIGDDAEIFGDDRKFAQFAIHGGEEFLTWAFHPAADAGRGAIGFHAPEGFEAAEMIEAKKVDDFEGFAETINPPAKSSFCDTPPVIGRRAPELAIFGEIIGRNAADGTRIAARIEIEKVAMTPDIGAVVFDVKGHVAHDEDVFRRARCVKGLPLAEEFELNEFVIADCLRIGFDARIELRPCYATVGVEEAHEFGVGIEPPGLFGFEGAVSGSGRKILEGFLKKSFFPAADADEVDEMCGEFRGGT